MKLDNYSMGFTSKEAFKNKLIEVIDKSDDTVSLTLTKKTIGPEGKVEVQTFDFV